MRLRLWVPQLGWRASSRAAVAGPSTDPRGLRSALVGQGAAGRSCDVRRGCGDGAGNAVAEAIPGGDLGQAVGDGHGPGRRGRWSCRNSERLGLRRPAGSAVRAGGQADIGDRAARAQEWCVHLPDGTSPGRPSPNRTSLSDQAQRGQRRLKREADVAYRDHPHDPPLDKVRPAESVPILCFRDRGRRGARINQFWLSGRAISGRVQPPPPATSSGGTTGLITSRVQAGIYASRSGTHAEITVAVDPPGGVTASFW